MSTDENNECLSESYRKIYFPKPFLKWVGGKTQIIEKLIKNFPKKINNYHEIFLGGGSVLFALLSFIKEGLIKLNGKVYAYDLNESLIHVYKNIQKNPIDVFNKVEELINDFQKCVGTEVNRNPVSIDDAKQSKENYYYWIRHNYNSLDRNGKNSINGSAMFIFLNKNCFRGLFRIGPNGFNVPYGNYVNPEIINKYHIMEIHELIQCVIFKNSDFTESFKNVNEYDYVYLDPPYYSDNNNSFVKYTENGFTLEQHENLFSYSSNFYNNNIQMMMSNSDTELVINYFDNDKHKIVQINAKRTINSKKPNAMAKELIIKNY